ncbi:hypothetical protein QUF81_21635 [Peribacillus simplex]|uniref:hypothetical protein n=1 Tax=Peribacillus simplex TaxID=1478 RepID=UPI0025A15A46|nr:hypothetical protein [Peribacillus simplex]MDM5295716.1 hypothetical protein [Peribacillus simplex]
MEHHSGIGSFIFNGEGHNKNIADKLKSDESIPAVDKPIELTLNRELKVQAPPFVIPSESFQTLSKVKDKMPESRKAFIQELIMQNEMISNKSLFLTLCLKN